MTRTDLLGRAVDECIKELYTYVQPKVNWEEFVEENKKYSEQYKFWEHYTNSFINREENPKLWLQYKSTFPDWENKSRLECIGPKPFEFYYLPKEIMKDVCDSYIYAYRLDSKQEFLDIIQILKDYCNKPIVSKYIEKDKGGYRGYEHPDNLERVINRYLDLEFPLMDPQRASDADDFDNKLEEASKKLQNKFFEFLDMAGNFYNWTRDLGTFNMSVYLGPSPSSDKKTVIENWKKYRNKDIEINEEQIKKEYYEED